MEFRGFGKCDTLRCEHTEEHRGDESRLQSLAPMLPPFGDVSVLMFLVIVHLRLIHYLIF